LRKLDIKLFLYFSAGRFDGQRTLVSENRASANYTVGSQLISKSACTHDNWYWRGSFILSIDLVTSDDVLYPVQLLDRRRTTCSKRLFAILSEVHAATLLKTENAF